MGLTDLLWLAGIAALTGGLLYRIFRARRVGCGGCASGCTGSVCPGSVKRR